MILIILTLLFSVFLEVNFLTMPLTLSVLIFWTVTTQKSEIYLFSFLAGLLLDMFSFNQVGFTSFFLLLTTLIIFLYRSKFEIKTVGFVAVFCFLASFVYLFLKGGNDLIFVSLLMSFVTAVSFKIYQRYNLQK